MKKLLCVFLALLATVCLLSVTVSAKASLTLSDDLQTLTLNNRTYSRADLSAIDVYYDDTTYDIQVPQHLQSQLKSAVAYSTSNQWIISLELYYLDGSRQDICFAYEPVKPELLRLCQDDELVCSMDVWWENTPSVTAPISKFKGTPIELDGRELIYDVFYQVTYEYRELGSYVYRGFVCEYLGKYYFVDYQENSIPNPVGFYPSEGPEYLKTYEITDQELIEQIDDALESQYSGSTETGQILSAIFLCFVFAVIPMAILILSVILSIRGKGYYRLTWGVTAGLCAAELSVFAIILSSILLAI